MTTVLYRKSSNEVIKISKKGQPFSDADPAFWGVLTDPSLPDGNEVRDDSGDDLGPLRVLGFAKIADPGTNTVSNALQTEINTFQSFQDDDEDRDAANSAKDLIENHPQFRRAVAAILATVEEVRPLAQRRTKKQLIEVAKGYVSRDD